MTACIKYLNTGKRHKPGECKACDIEMGWQKKLDNIKNKDHKILGPEVKLVKTFWCRIQ